MTGTFTLHNQTLSLAGAIIFVQCSLLYLFNEAAKFTKPHQELRGSEGSAGHCELYIIVNVGDKPPSRGWFVDR